MKILQTKHSLNRKILRLPVFTCTLLCLCNLSNAQAILNIEGASIHTEANTLIHVNGDVSFTDGNIEHNGVMELTGNWSNINQNQNEAFAASSNGEVKLITGIQEIQGYTTTAFPSLSLEGYDTKRLIVNTKVTRNLNLNNIQLDVRGNDMWVTNTATNAITRSTGYVNTSDHPLGRLVRSVTAGSSYDYPLGGGAQYKFRPVNAIAADDGVLAAQFQNYDPGNDGFQRMQSAGVNYNVINDKFYHVVTSVSGVTNADIKIAYNTTEDGSFNGLARFIDNHWLDAGNYRDAAESGEGTDHAMHHHISSAGAHILALSDTIATDPIFVVSGFTPNNDGKNDYFAVKGLENYKFNELKVFNRWGRIVYTTLYYKNDWAGNGLDMGTYMYVLRVVDMKGKERIVKGDVTLIR